MYVGKDEILDFSDQIMSFIKSIGLVNEHGNLIIDYIEGLYLNGFPVLESDIERQVYIFYNYVEVHEYILRVHGEEDFINHIIALELKKL